LTGAALPIRMMPVPSAAGGHVRANASFV